MATIGSAPHVLLAHFKDDFFEREVASSVSATAERLVGARVAQLLAPELQLLATVCYGSATLLSDAPSPGEDYVGLVRVTGPRTAFVQSARLVLHTQTRSQRLTF